MAQPTYDVVVIGGAVMGASAAFWLTKLNPGMRVLVVEQDASFAKAGTALSVASIRSQFSTDVNVKISRYGIDFIRNFQECLGHDVGVPSLGVKENGYLFLARSTDGAALLADLAQMQRGHGAATTVLTPDETQHRYSWLNTSDLTAASFGPRDEGWFDNIGLLAGFRSAAKAQGVTFVTDQAIRFDMSQGRVTAVRLHRLGPVTCGQVINAAGTRAATVAGWAGIDIPVEPRKRTVFVIDAPNAAHPDAPLMIDAGFYLRPEHGTQWITATVPSDDGPCDAGDFEPDLHLFEDVIWEQLYHRAPCFDAVKVVRHWVGHYAYNRLDQNAILGTHPAVENLYFMNGCSGHGLQQSPAIGRYTAELMLHGTWRSLDLGDLSIARIIDGKPLLEKAVV